MDDPEQLLDRLVEADVLVEVAEDRLEPSSAFRRERQASRGDMESGEAASVREAYADATGADAASLTDDLLADATAIRRLDGDLDRQGALVAADALERFVDETLAEGVPEGFVPVRAGEVLSFLDRHEASVLYFWGDDCDPCEAVRLEFEGLVREGRVPEGVALGAVYLGRDAEITQADVDLIADEWQVASVPTTLFFAGRTIDTRLIGAKKAGHFEREMEILLREYVEGGERTESTSEVDQLLDAKARGELEGNVIDHLEERDAEAAASLEGVSEADAEAALTADIDDLLDSNSDLEVEVDPADFVTDPDDDPSDGAAAADEDGRED